MPTLARPPVKRRLFAIERRALRAPFRRLVGVEVAPILETAATPRRTGGNQHSEGDGSVVLDLSHMLDGRTTFPRVLWGDGL